MIAKSTIETIRGKFMQTVTIIYSDTDKRAAKTIGKLDSLGYRLISENETRWGSISQYKEKFAREYKGKKKP